MELLNKEDVNTGRQIEFDIAKAICIIGMVFVHVYESFIPESLMTSGFQNILVNIVQMLVGAPCFMICMGIGIAYTSKNSPKDLINRGIKIFIFAYILNFIRGGIPEIAAFIAGKVSTAEFITNFTYEFLNNDIMPFAGLALILMGLLKKWKLNDKYILLTALVMSIAGSFIKGIDVSRYINYPLGLFVGTYDYAMDEIIAFFPLLNWFIFVASGYYFGKILKKVNDKKKFYLMISPACAVLVTIYLFFAIPNNIGMINPDLVYYYHLNSFDALISIMSSLAVFGFYFYISSILPKFLINFSNSASRNINRIYCIHWVIVGWTDGFLYYFRNINYFDQSICVLFAIAVFGFSYVLSLMYERRLLKHGNKN